MHMPPRVCVCVCFCVWLHVCVCVGQRRLPGEVGDRVWSAGNWSAQSLITRFHSSLLKSAVWIVCVAWCVCLCEYQREKMTDVTFDRLTGVLKSWLNWGVVIDRAGGAGTSAPFFCLEASISEKHYFQKQRVFTMTLASSWFGVCNTQLVFCAYKPRFKPALADFFGCLGEVETSCEHDIRKLLLNNEEKVNLI